MATVDDWNKYINLLHELAVIEDDLREWAYRIIPLTDEDEGKRDLASTILFERLGVDTL